VLAERGMTYEGPNHAFCKRPEVDIARRAEAHMLRVADALGFSPAARTKIQVDDVPDWEDTDEYRAVFGEDRPRSRPPRRTRAKEDDPDGPEDVESEIETEEVESE
jgi:hypothetical protein